MVGSEGEAEQLVLSILPEVGVRRKCLEILADAIAEANIYGRDRWAVVHTSRKVRLIVGYIIVCTLADGHVWMALDKGLLGSSNDRLIPEQSGDWEWDADGYPECPSISSRNGHYRPSEKHPELWPVVRRLHFESVYRAANQTTMDPRTPQGHAPEILRYVRNDLGRHLPDPLH